MQEGTESMPNTLANSADPNRNIPIFHIRSLVSVNAECLFTQTVLTQFQLSSAFT